MCRRARSRNSPAGDFKVVAVHFVCVCLSAHNLKHQHVLHAADARCFPCETYTQRLVVFCCVVCFSRVQVASRNAKTATLSGEKENGRRSARGVLPHSSIYVLYLHMNADMYQ